VDFGSDVIVLDLEDAVADAKEGGGARARPRRPRGYDTSATVTVRVNSVASELFREDVAAVVCDRLDGLLIPKVEDRRGGAGERQARSVQIDGVFVDYPIYERAKEEASSPTAGRRGPP
jgi:citrate lyase beta subunit